MTTYVQLQAEVSRDLADPSNLTFDVNSVKDFIQQGLAEVSRFAPQQYQEDIAPVAAQLTYPLRSAIFTTPPQEIRLVRVEIWRGTPNRRFAFKIKSKSGMPTRDSVAGWEVWGGVLELPDVIVDNNIVVATDTIRTWGYSPYPPIVNDSDVLAISAELELAVRAFCRLEGLRRLISSRVLFKQWQTHSNNSDVTMAQINSDLQAAEARWKVMSRSLKVPEQSPD